MAYNTSYNVADTYKYLLANLQHVYLWSILYRLIKIAKSSSGNRPLIIFKLFVIPLVLRCIRLQTLPSLKKTATAKGRPLHLSTL